MKKDYFVFISYSSLDKDWAKWLRRKLRNYHLPTAFNGRTDIRKNLREVFRDRDELKAGPEWDKQVRDALSNTKNLLVICSANAFNSDSVKDEIKYFRSINKDNDNHIFPFIIEGNPEESFPSYLNHSKLAGDVNKDGSRDAAFIKVVAGMLDIDFTELWQEDEREKHKRRLKILSFVLAGFILLFGLLWYLDDMFHEKDWNMMEKQTRAVTEKIPELLSEGNSLLSQLLLLEVLPGDIKKPDRPYLSEAEVLLREANNMDCYILPNYNEIISDLSPDGKYVLVGDEDGIGNLIDINSGSCMMKLNNHNICSASFSPDQKLISTVIGIRGGWHSGAPKEYSNILLWDTEDGSLKMTLKGHGEQVIKTFFSDDGRLLVSSSYDGTIRFWDVISGKCYMKLNDDGYNNYDKLSGNNNQENNISKLISLSPDGKKLLTNFTTKNIEIWDTQRGICIDTLKGHTNIVLAFHFSPDGNEIVSAGSDSTIRLWDVSTGNCKRVLSGHTGSIRDVSYNQNGTKIVTASSDSTIRIWNLQNGACEKQLKLNTIAMKATFTPNEQKIIVSSNDKNVRVWEPYKNPTKTLINSHVSSVTFSSGGEYVAYKGVADDVKIWDVVGQREFCLDMSKYVESLFFNNDGTKLITTSYGSRGHIINVWNTIDHRLLCTIKPAEGYSRFKGINICDDDTIVTVADGTTGFWNANTGNCIKVISNQFNNRWNNIAISPNGQKLAAVSSADSIYLTNLSTGASMLSLGHHRGAVCLSFSMDNTLLASGAADGIIKLWKISNDGEPLVLDGGSSQVSDLFFSKDMNYLVSIHKKGIVNIWNTDTGDKVGTFKGDGDVFLSIHFCLDKDYIEGVSENGIIYTWSFPPLQQLINETRERFKNRKLTPEEKRKFFTE